MKHKCISKFAILAILLSCLSFSTAGAVTEGQTKGTPKYDPITKKLLSCDRGGCGCTIKIVGVPFSVLPPPGGSVGADPLTEVQLGEDLYQAVAFNIDMPVGFQNVQFVLYSKTGRDVQADFDMLYPNIPSIDNNLP